MGDSGMAEHRTAVVTGASGGIGVETTRALAARGFHVVMLCRSAQKAEATRADIEYMTPDASLDVVLADLSSMEEVRSAADEITGRLDRLDVLVNNAGIMQRRPATTPEGLDLMVATNHLGPFLLTNLLLALMRRSAPSRIVNVASEAHKFSRLHLDDVQGTPRYGLLGMRRYGETKLMNVLFTRELARRLAGSGVTANAVHPGAVATNLGEPPAVIAALSSRFMKTATEGAATSIRVATDPALDGVTGHYFVNERQADQKLGRHARDEAAARALWDRSEVVTGIAT